MFEAIFTQIEIKRTRKTIVKMPFAYENSSGLHVTDASASLRVMAFSNKRAGAKRSRAERSEAESGSASLAFDGAISTRSGRRRKGWIGGKHAG